MFAGSEIDRTAMVARTRSRYIATVVDFLYGRDDTSIVCIYKYFLSRVGLYGIDVKFVG